MNQRIFRNGGMVYEAMLYRGCNVRLNNYEQAKARYESVKPIGGLRKKFGGDFRPITDRYRTWEVFMRKGDDYGFGFSSSYITYTHEKDADGKNVAKPIKLNGTVYPVVMFSPDGVVTYTANWASSYTTWDILAAVLPDGMRLAKFGSKQYMELAQPDGSYKYFLSPMHGLLMRFIPYESDGKRFFRVHPDDITRESKIVVDRDKSKRMGEEFKAFIEYHKMMGDLITSGMDVKDHWRERKGLAFLSSNDWLFREKGEDYGSKWADAIVAFFQINNRVTQRWNSNTQTFEITDTHRGNLEDILKMPRSKLVRMTKPYKRVDVPIGVGFRPNGRTL